MSTIAEAFALGLSRHQAGDFRHAESIYRQILGVFPSHAQSMHYLGLIALQVGRVQEALGLIRKSVEIRGDIPLFYCNLGLAYEAAGALNEAEASYRQALKMKGDLSQGIGGLGNVLAKRGMLDQAIEHYRRAIRLNRNDADAHHNLADIYRRQGKFKEAEIECRAALRINPSFAAARNTQGIIRCAEGRFEEALADFRNAIDLMPNDPRGHNHLAATLQMLGRNEQAIVSYQRALVLAPQFAEAHSNLGVLLQDMGHLDDAEAHLREAARLQPGLADAFGNLGGVLQLEGKLVEAIQAFRQAEAITPNDPLPSSNILLCMNYDPLITPQALAAAHRTWGMRHVRPEKYGPAIGHDRDPNRRLRIGYVSPDLRSHPLAAFFEPILANHDPAEVETYCYAAIATPDAVTDRLKSAAGVWRAIEGLSNAAGADLIRDDQIDILVDLAGHTARNRLGIFAHKPAPIQITYLGYPNTTGLASIDYRLTDSVADPQGEAADYVEELVRLPHGFSVYLPNAAAPEVSALPAKAKGHITFGSLHNLPRLNPLVVNMWCDLLQAIPSSRLLIFRNTLRGMVRNRLLAEFTRRGISPERLDLRHSPQNGRGYLDVYDEVDISLDTFPWSGHTTACESLWMGVPVVTLRGNRHAGRMVASVLTQVGMPELIADSPTHYLRIAASLAGDVEALGRLRADLREKMRSSRLCDGKQFTHDLEDQYRALWQRWCNAQGEPQEQAMQMAGAET